MSVALIYHEPILPTVWQLGPLFPFDIADIMASPGATMSGLILLNTNIKHVIHIILF